MYRLRPTALLLTVVALGSCASAGDRLEEGIEAEAYGRYYAASMRYVEALEKDETMVEARDRLLVTGDSAIQEGLRDAEERLAIRDAVGAGEEFLRLDRLLSAARSVGVRLPTPADFLETRRGTFDAAVDDLMELADEGARRREWGTARSALVRVRSDFEPDDEQREASTDAEARLLLDWAHYEEDARRYRRAFDLAGEMLAMGRSAPADLADDAVALQERALDLGTLFVAVFPVDLAPELRGRGEENPSILLSDALELDYWRAPPAFVAVADPVRVRQLTRRYSPPGTPLRPRRILDEVRADFGVLIEITQLTRSERNVRERVRTAQTDGGGTVRYTLQEGTQRYEIRAQVVLLDAAGRTLDDFHVSENVSGPFSRAVYDGDIDDLDLSRNERMLFDPVPQAQARAQLEARLAGELAEVLADQLFTRLLRRVP